MRRLHHPNIVACTGVAASSSTVYIVMELMPMGDLHGYLLTRATKRTPLGIAERGWICYQVRAMGSTFRAKNRLPHAVWTGARLKCLAQAEL